MAVTVSADDSALCKLPDWNGREVSVNGRYKCVATRVGVKNMAQLILYSQVSIITNGTQFFLENYRAVWASTFPFMRQ